MTWREHRAADLIAGFLYGVLLVSAIWFAKWALSQ